MLGKDVRCTRVMEPVMPADNQPPSYARVRSTNHDQNATNTKEAAMREEAGLLPVAVSSEEITEQDFNLLLSIANDPNATKGRLNIKPRRIPLREQHTVVN
jgi:hypothetical protein